MRFQSCLLLIACCAGCFAASPIATSDSGAPDAGNAGDDAATDGALGLDVVQVTGSETWADGKNIASSVVVESGSLVTIAAGATITVAAGAVIEVNGALVAQSASGTHAKLTGTGWGGIRVQGYGVLTLDGVDLENPSVGLDIHAEAPCKYDDGIITGAGTPFSIATGGNLSTAHSSVVVPQGISRVAGSFTASYLDYNANDHGAILTTDPSAYVFIEDSTFHDSGPLGAGKAPDLITSNAATKIHVAYSDLSGAHCGLHFDAIDSFEVDHLTVHDVANGADLWGSSASTGTRTITSSNFESLTENFDESGTNGPVSITGCYLTGTNVLTDSMVTIGSSSAQPIAGAGPR